MFGRILLPLDGSSLAELALRHAEVLAEASEAEVMLLRVIEPEPRSAGVPQDVLAWGFRRVAAEASLAKVAERFRSRGVRTSFAVEEGDAAERILDHAREREVDLLVLTSHGHGGVTEFDIAGTAQKVLSRSPASVLLVPARARPTEIPDQPLYRTIVALVDCSQRGDCAVNIASDVAHGASAELALVHVVPEPELTARMPLGADDLALIEGVIVSNRRAAERYLRETRKRLSGPGHPVRVHSSVARDVVSALTDFLSRERPELVVICAHGSTARSDRGFGRVARSLLTSARVPLLVVQDARASYRPEPKAAALALAGNGRRTAAHDR